MNRIVRSVRPSSLFESAAAVISSAVSFNQGDLLFFDDTNNLIKPVTADADGATFCGIARVTISSGKLLSPYQGTAVDAAVSSVDIPGPQFGVIAKVKLKVADVFNPGDLVYATAVDAQTVSSAGVNSIGVFQGKAITAAAGDEGEVLLFNKAKLASL
jgi:hypothetical protein